MSSTKHTPGPWRVTGEVLSDGSVVYNVANEEIAIPCVDEVGASAILDALEVHGLTPVVPGSAGEPSRMTQAGGDYEPSFESMPAGKVGDSAVSNTQRLRKTVHDLLAVCEEAEKAFRAIARQWTEIPAPTQQERNRYAGQAKHMMRVMAAAIAKAKGEG